MDGVFGPLHRAFLQSLLNEQSAALSHDALIDRVRSLLERMNLEEDDDIDAMVQEHLGAFLGTCKHKLDTQFGMDIKRMRIDGIDYYALISTLQDDISTPPSSALAEGDADAPHKKIMQLVGTDYTRYELGYLRRLIEMILMSTGTFEITSTEAINEARSLDLPSQFTQTQQMTQADTGTQVPAGTQAMKPMTSSQAQNLLNTFVKDGWLIETRGRITLSPRSKMELESSGSAFLQAFAEFGLRKCLRCDRWVMEVGVDCDACQEGAFHTGCFEAQKRALGNQQADIRCNHCQSIIRQ